MRTDDYEKELLEAYEGGGMSPRDSSEALNLRLVQASENTFKKDKRINVRLSSHGLEGIQRKAVRKGDPLSGPDLGFDTSVCRRRSHRKVK